MSKSVRKMSMTVHGAMWARPIDESVSHQLLRVLKKTRTEVASVQTIVTTIAPRTRAWMTKGELRFRPGRGRVVGLR